MIDNYYDLFLGYLNKINFYNNFDKSIKTCFTDDKLVINFLYENEYFWNFTLILYKSNIIEYYSNNQRVLYKFDVPYTQSNNPEDLKYYLLNSISEMEKLGDFPIEDKIKNFIKYVLDLKDF